VILIGIFGRLDMPNVVAFTARQEAAQVRSDRLDGVQLTAELPKGWSGTIDLDRGSRGIDDFFAATEAAWIDAGQYNVGQMFVYIREADQSLSFWAYDNVALRLDDAGDFRPDAVTRQRIMWRANRKRGA
jgi:hypothetical protein